MFSQKVSNLLNTNNTKKETENAFINAAMKQTNTTLSGNGSLKYTTTGNDFVDNFANVASFKKPRTYAEVAQDMQLLWSQNPELCLKLAVYIRMITRKTNTVDHFGSQKVKTLSTQRGQGLKNEGIMRMMWIAINHPQTFAENIVIFIEAGSWKDIIVMMNLDLQYHGWDGRKLDWNFLGNVIYAGLMNETQTHLVRKYLPKIRTNGKARTLESQADTIIGRWLARRIFKDMPANASYKEYRLMKSSGVAHKWQQLISKQLFNSINFNSIAGRALQQLVNSKFLDNHNLRDKYTEWITSQKTAKFTGFVFELFKPLEPSGGWGSYNFANLGEAEKATINAQFYGLVEKGKGDAKTTTRLLVARDISGSMTSKATGCNMSSYSVAKALALYFSEFLTGPFANSYVEFADQCRLVQWKGKTPVDKWVNDKNANFGSTNFLSIAHLFADLKRRGLKESEFPEGLLCVSDGEFNGYYSNNETNFQQFRSILLQAGFSKEYVDNFKLILWDIPNGYYGKTKPTFEEFANAPNSFHMSGYDPSIVAFLMDGDVNPCNSQELFMAAMNQELLNKLRVVD